ncbi:UxaA family hydrolase [Catenovulum sp. SX2]|uniref:UxaA family hydrolase n=1 Tax=Catenovulum sp. SX2 TaxID=3398614 RepID=UPI003F85D174
MSAIDKRFVLLDARDNVLVCCQNSPSGELVQIEQLQVPLSCEIQVGHKIARTFIRKGEKIIKYGAPIGSATQDLAIGEHVHMHNMQSDYISSHTRAQQVEKRQ